MQYTSESVNKTFYLVIFPSKTYMLFDQDMKKLPIYIGINRQGLTNELRKIRDVATKETKLKVYTIDNNDNFKLNTQPNEFNLIIPAK